MGRMIERFSAALQAPVKTQYMSGFALLIAVIALGISMGVLLSIRGGNVNAR